VIGDAGVEYIDGFFSERLFGHLILASAIPEHDARWRRAQMTELATTDAADLPDAIAGRIYLLF
jgi:hypothetical protein